MTDAMQADPLGMLLSGRLQLNGVTTAGDRLFGVSQGAVQDPGSGSPQVVEYRDGRPVAYPDQAWSSWREGEDVAGRFVRVNSIRVLDGVLWAVDCGSLGPGRPRIPDAPRLIGFDLERGAAARTYPLQPATRPWSFVDDVRFHGDFAYLTDAGSPALIVLHLPSGRARRVLEGQPSVVAQRPLRAEHRDLAFPDGSRVVIHVDQLEVSPDGAWLYYQPCCGGMSRIPTAVLEDPDADEQRVADAVEFVAATPSTGGTAIAADGTIYLSDVDRSRILTVSPGGAIEVVLDDVRLAWIDAMWIDDDGSLLMPAAQLNRSAGLNWGIDVVVPPCVVYRYPTGKDPARS